MLKFTVICSLLLGTLICCIGPGSRPNAAQVTGKPEHFLQTSYTKGAIRTAKIGEPIATVKDFSLVRKFPNYLFLDRQITIKTEKRSLILPHGRILRFSGVANIDGENLPLYLDAYSDDGLGVVYYVKEDMSLAKFIFIRNRIAFPDGMEPITSVTPETFKFRGRIETDPASEKVFKNYDLSFTGMDGNGIHATYREHDLADPAKVASTREWTFPADSSRIRCVNLEIQVHRCSALALEFSVTTD